MQMGRTTLYTLAALMLSGCAANPTPHPQSDAVYTPPSTTDAVSTSGGSGDSSPGQDAAVLTPTEPETRTDCEAAGGVWDDADGCFGAEPNAGVDAALADSAEAGPDSDSDSRGDSEGDAGPAPDGLGTCDAGDDAPPGCCCEGDACSLPCPDTGSGGEDAAP